MTKDIENQPKKRLSRSVVTKNQWVSLYKDRILSTSGQELEYWCVDRSNSAIVIVIQDGLFLLSDKQFRPGINKSTLDFVGGRIDKKDPKVAAELILRRELQISKSDFLTIKPLNNEPLFVDSSFSDQEIYGFVAEIDKQIVTKTKRYTLEELFDNLYCLQCRVMLYEWQRQFALID